MFSKRDHGGGLDLAIDAHGGSRKDWVDLSTGINPIPYPIPTLTTDAWTALPDHTAANALCDAARRFWDVPKEADILAAPGASILIAQIPRLAKAGSVNIATPTYNEHAASFAAHEWSIVSSGECSAQVLVHPNNPDGFVWSSTDITAPLAIIDESFCDVSPHSSLINLAARPGTLVLKSFGKFWGLAGLRLGFAIGDPSLIAALKEMLGPWPVSGVALEVGTAALNDPSWAAQTRKRLGTDAARLDAIVCNCGATLVGGTSLFRLYQVDDATAWQRKLARGRVWSRIFPYASDWIRLGLPAPEAWAQVEAAL